MEEAEFQLQIVRAGSSKIKKVMILPLSHAYTNQYWKVCRFC